MKYFTYFITIVVLFGLNTGLFSYFQIVRTVPNLLLLLLVLVALHKDSEVYFIAFIAGLFLDFSTGVFFGSFTLAFLTLSLVSTVVLERILVLELNWKYVVSSVVGSMLLVDFVLWGYNLLALKLGLSLYGLDVRILVRQFVPELIYNLLLLYPMYEVVGFVREWLLSQERKTVIR